MELNRGGVVIPAYGMPDMTAEVVADCLREADLVHVVVVDNAGDYTAPAGRGVQVLRPGENLGWLRGTNLGVATAAAAGCDWLVPLNNDTRLSDGFFAGLRAALERRPEDLVAPCYDDAVPTQNRYHRGPVEEFVPEPVELGVPLIDGTCFAFTTERYRALGPLDATAFGRHGWGAMEDYVLRNRALGGGCAVTHRAYLTHASGVTADAVLPVYTRYATSEMRRGLRRKYGRHWRVHFPPLADAPDTPRVLLSDTVRVLESRLGLRGTRVGRR
ncbi:glycosyltransferase [Geodermatophilus sp. SYSU D00815]